MALRNRTLVAVLKSNCCCSMPLWLSCQIGEIRELSRQTFSALFASLWMDRSKSVTSPSPQIEDSKKKCSPATTLNKDPSPRQASDQNFISLTGLLTASASFQFFFFFRTSCGLEFAGTP